MENTTNSNLVPIFQFLSVVLTGLVAGLLYGYDCSVIKGLGNLENESYLKAFQSINKAIQNPYFFTSFMGCLLVLPVTCWLSYKTNQPTFHLSLAAALVYLIGVFGVTLFCNVPLNQQLEHFNISAAPETQIAAMRRAFEHSWNKYHTIRTIAAIIAFSLLILSLLKRDNSLHP